MDIQEGEGGLFSPPQTRQSFSVPQGQAEQLANARPPSPGYPNSNVGSFLQGQPALPSRKFPQPQIGGSNIDLQRPQAIVEMQPQQTVPNYAAQSFPASQDLNGHDLGLPQQQQPASTAPLQETPQRGATMSSNIRPASFNVNSAPPGLRPSTQQGQQSRPPSVNSVPQVQQGSPMSSGPTPNARTPHQQTMNQQQASSRPSDLISAGQQRPGNSPSPRPGPQVPPTLQPAR